MGFLRYFSLRVGLLDNLDELPPPMVGECQKHLASKAGKGFASVLYFILVKRSHQERIVFIEHVAFRSSSQIFFGKL